MSQLPLGSEIFDRVEQLAAFSESERALTRRFLTAEHARANQQVGKWMREAGMQTRIDPVGNVVGRYEGEQPGLPALLIGSHLDTVSDAGKYDGTLGVLCGISAVGELARHGERLPFAIEVIGFGDEEGLRYRSTFLGSRALAGTFDPELLDRVDGDGVPMREAFASFGLDAEKVEEAARAHEDFVGYVEVHIEQGPVLEAESLAVGVVSSIAGATRLDISVEGTAGHAGTVPMSHRRDALCAAAELVCGIESRCAAGELVATVGQMRVEPGAVNVIPGRVELTLDVRAPDDARRRAALNDVQQLMREIEARRGVAIASSITHDSASCLCDESLTRRLGSAIEAQGLRLRALPSGAGHDAMAIAVLTPVAMLFVRCAGGISHHPDESMTVEDAEIATRVLCTFLRNYRA